MKAFIRVLQDLGLVIARLVFGGIMVAHGWHRWQGEGMAKQVEYLQTAGVPQPDMFAWGTVILEVVGGVLIVFGVLTPLVALVFLVQQVMIIAYGKYSHGLYLTDGGVEYNAMTGALAVVFLVFGGGRAAVDNLFRRPSDEKMPATRDVVDSDPA